MQSAKIVKKPIFYHPLKGGGILVQGLRDSRKHENIKNQETLKGDKVKSNAKLKSNNFENCKLNIMYTNIDCISNKIAFIRDFYSFNKNRPNIIILTEINAKNFKYPIIDT